MTRTYRALSPGEAVPAWPPMRSDDKGYVRLRWKVGTGAYVETYEHRVLDGVVTTAAHVHHRNGIRSDNAPANLAPGTPLEHLEQHASYDIGEAIRLHEQGATFSDLARRYGVHPTSVLRRFQRRGILTARSAKFHPRKTHCVHGHELTGDNIQLYGKHRPCRLCRNASRRARRQALTFSATHPGR